MLERHIPLLLCCAEDNEVALVRVVDILHREGYAPEVVSGIEHDATLITAAVDRVAGPALFVFCQSAELDRSRIRRLMGLLSARSGGAQASLVVHLRTDRPLAILPAVRSAAAGVLDGTYQGEGPESSERDGRKEVIFAPDVALEKAKTPRRKREPAARSDAADATAPEESPEERRAGRAAKRAQQKRVPPRAESAELTGVPVLLPGPDDVHAIDPSTDDLAAYVDVDAFLDERASTHASRENTTPAAHAVQRPEKQGPHHRQMRRQLVIAASTAACTVALVVLGSLWLRGSESTEVSNGGTAAVVTTDPSPGPDVAQQAEPVTAVAAARPLIPPPPSVASTNVPLSPALERALESGHAKRVKDVVVVSVSEEPTTWTLAADHCDGKDHALQARLPTRKELRILGRSGVLDPGTYWSNDLGEHDDEAHAIDIPSGQMNVYLHEESIARAVCVVPTP